MNENSKHQAPNFKFDTHVGFQYTTLILKNFLAHDDQLLSNHQHKEVNDGCDDLADFQLARWRSE